MKAIELPTPEVLLAEFRSRAENDPGNAVRRLVERLQSAAALVPVWQQLAASLLAQGDALHAGTLLEHGLQIHPGEPALHYLLGNALRVQGKLESAERELRSVLTVDPAHINAAASLAFLLRELGRMGEATAVMHARWQSGRYGPDEARRTATFMAQCNRHMEAIEVCTQALAAQPDANLFALRGTLAMTLGEFEQASDDLRRAVGINPKLAASWLWLAMSHKFKTRNDPDLLALEAIAAKYPAGSEVRICTGFALGKAYDDLDDIPAAVRALREANSIMAERVAWQTREWNDFVESQIAAALPTPVADSEIMPVFVVGLPRTGTTLVSMLLSRHPLVRNRGEMGWLAGLAEQGAPRNYPARFLAHAAKLYGAQLRQDDEPAHCYIDKNPFGFRYLGLAAALFPRARVIHCRREPRDCVLSAWRQYFANPEAGYTYRFSDMAAVSKGHDQLMEHWRATLPLPIFELEYETLVARPEETVSALLGFLDLEPESRAAVMENKREAIGTASVWQARQPIYGTSVGRWRAYAEYLPELMEAFQDGGTPPRK